MCSSVEVFNPGHYGIIKFDELSKTKVIFNDYNLYYKPKWLTKHQNYNTYIKESVDLDFFRE